MQSLLKHKGDRDGNFPSPINLNLPFNFRGRQIITFTFNNLQFNCLITPNNRISHSHSLILSHLLIFFLIQLLADGFTTKKYHVQRRGVSTSEIKGVVRSHDDG
jgi:hypothetical protein